MSVRSVFTIMLVVCGIVATIVLVTVIRSHSLVTSAMATSSQPSLNANGPASLPEYPSTSVSCTGPAKSSASHGSLQDVANRARMLAQAQHAPEALERYDDLQQLDPGYPGLQLDRATALIASQKYEDALRAVNLQISISQCMERLPESAMESYCKHEEPDKTPVLCRAELHTLERTAHFQAAIIEMQLGKKVDAALQANDAGTTMPSAELQPEPLPRSAPAAPVAQREAKPAQHTAISRKPSHADPLASAAGTDAALGAYSH